MPPALQIANFFKQGLTGGALEALSPGSGDNNTFQTFTLGTPAWLCDVKGVDDASPCLVSMIASRFHDQILGLCGYIPDGSTLGPPNRATSISPPGVDQPIYPADVMTVQVQGTAADNVNVGVVLYYSDLPGISAVLRTSAQVKSAIKNQVGVQVTVDPSGLAQGDWSAGVSLTAAGRRLDAGAKYAVCGFTSPVPLAMVGLSSFETGNIKVGGPVLGDGEIDANMLLRYADMYGTPLVPVISGDNQDTVNIFAADPAAGSTTITVNLVELTHAV